MDQSANKKKSLQLGGQPAGPLGALDQADVAVR
jgi:hypothetical protein